MRRRLIGDPNAAIFASPERRRLIRHALKACCFVLLPRAELLSTRACSTESTRGAAGRSGWESRNEKPMVASKPQCSRLLAAGKAWNRLSHLLLLVGINELCTRAVVSTAWLAQLHTRARTSKDPREEGEITRQRQAQRRRQRLEEGLRAENALHELRRRRTR